MLNAYKTQQGRGIPAFDHSLIEQIRRPDAYLPSESLKRAVDLALLLGQPLLLTGEPGTGKTQLASHLARHFSADGQDADFYVFNTKTTSTAQDLLYRYDALRHFQYAQNNPEPLSNEEVMRRFVRYQALGQAILSNRRAVVLIDEIDKAPRDFPNDLLDVLDELSFEVPELEFVGNRRIKTLTQHRPLVVLTSNSEKDLPAPFLRRCIFFHIEFPEPAMLERILTTKLSRFTEEQVKSVVAHFLRIREQCKRKQPSTAELLYWSLALEKLDEQGLLPIAKLDAPENEAQRAELQSSYSLLIKNKDDWKDLPATR